MESWFNTKNNKCFSNDTDSWGGGYIVIGAKEQDGKLVRPITGLEEKSIDHIQKELLKYCNYLKPKYNPQSEPVKFEGKHFLLVWCPGGYDRPYQCPKRLEQAFKLFVHFAIVIENIIYGMDLM